MDLQLMLSYLAAAMLLTIMPGPDNLFVLAQSIVTGARAGLSTSLGLCTGLLVHIAAATFGVSALIYQSAAAFNVVKYAGAVYLLWLAYRSFRDKSAGFRLSGAQAAGYAALYRRGIVMNVLNPKVSLFFLAFLPQFIRPEAGQAPQQMLVYGLLFIVQALAIFAAISLFADRVGKLLQRKPAWARRLNVAQGVLLLFIGLRMAVSRQ